jgi:hypothetical protein
MFSANEPTYEEVKAGRGVCTHHQEAKIGTLVGAKQFIIPLDLLILV